MDINPLDAVEATGPGPKDVKPSLLNPAVAITVALLATFMGICKVKDGAFIQGRSSGS